MSTVQNPEQFLDDFIACAQQATQRIYIQTMIFERGDILSKLEPVLLQKAKEGVAIHITVDWITKRYVHDDLGVLPVLDPQKRSYNSGVRRQTQEIIKRWTDKGITFTTTNIPHPLHSPMTIFRRNHTKIFLVDDNAAWIGGLNLFDLAFDWIDFMVKFTDEKTVSALAHQFTRVNNNRPKDNYAIQCNPESTLLMDAGLVGKSIIYNEAITCVKNAEKSILFASQFLPDDVILNELIKASKKGILVTVITSNEDYKAFNNFPYKFAYQRSLKKIRGTDINLFHQNTKVHAKLLLVDNKTAMFGSHNFVHIGVILGTEEIAMKTEDPNLLEQIKSYVATNIITAL